MCINRAILDAGKSERQRLEEALNRDSIKQHQWCMDGRTIIEAAREYLKTLPNPPRKVMGWAVVSCGVILNAYHDRASASAACGPDSHVVQVTGEYEE